ncbi:MULTISPECIES: T9SS type A sorting domain-containing protein [unclassified Lacinutrix]
MKIYILLFLFYLLTPTIHAQDGYTYTLVDNGSYNYTISARPNISASDFATLVQSYGFTIILTDGITASITSSLGNGANATYFDGNNVSQPSIDGYLITETLGSLIALPAPSSGLETPMVSIQVNGAPTNGSISLLANDSVLATTVTPLVSFMQADMIDDSMFLFTNVVDPNASALSGTSSYNFDTLDIEDNEMSTFSMHPNPATSIVKIEVPENFINYKIEIHDTLGKQISMSVTPENTFNVSKLSTGMYLVSIKTEGNKITKKLIVK